MPLFIEIQLSQENSPIDDMPCLLECIRKVLDRFSTSGCRASWAAVGVRGSFKLHYRRYPCHLLKSPCGKFKHLSLTWLPPSCLLPFLTQDKIKAKNPGVLFKICIHLEHLFSCSINQHNHIHKSMLIEKSLRYFTLPGFKVLLFYWGFGWGSGINSNLGGSN